MRISYFELLQLINDGEIPEKLKVHLTSEYRIYKADYDQGDFNGYILEDHYKEDDDFKYYLADCFLESMMFDSIIEIVEKCNIEPLGINFTVEDIRDKLNEVINYLKNKKS